MAQHRLAQLKGPGAIAQGVGAVAAGQDALAVGQAGGPFVYAREGALVIIGGAKGPDQAQALRRYLTRLRQSCNALPLAALGGEEEAGEEVSLNQVYIDLDTRTPIRQDDDRRAARSAPGEMDAFLERKEDRVRSALEVATQDRRLVLLGDPGSGKSTFVRQLAAWLATASLGEGDPLPGWPAWLIPLLVTLRDLAPRLQVLKRDGCSEEKRDRRLLAAVRKQWQAQLESVQAAAVGVLRKATETATDLRSGRSLRGRPDRIDHNSPNGLRAGVIVN